MKTSKIITILLSLFVTMPIWFFLLYTILSAINPDRLVWFLYWAYVPIHIINVTIAEIVKENE